MFIDSVHRNEIKEYSSKRERNDWWKSWLVFEFLKRTDEWFPRNYPWRNHLWTVSTKKKKNSYLFELVLARSQHMFLTRVLDRIDMLLSVLGPNKSNLLFRHTLRVSFIFNTFIGNDGQITSAHEQERNRRRRLKMNNYPKIYAEKERRSFLIRDEYVSWIFEIFVKMTIRKPPNSDIWQSVAKRIESWSEMKQYDCWWWLLTRIIKYQFANQSVHEGKREIQTDDQT